MTPVRQKPSADGSAGRPTQPSGIRTILERHFRPAAAILLVAMAATQFAAMQSETVANDEGYHILNGYAYLKTGRLPLTTEHPPLGELIPALPLLFLNLQLPGHLVIVPSDESEERAREQEFLFNNRRSAETILLFARLMEILLTMLLGLLILWWTWRHFGPIPALAAESLLAFDPNFIANGHYALNDVPVALCFLGCILSWNAFLADGHWRTAALCGGLSGIAITTKYNAVLLVPIYVLMYLVRWWQQASAPEARTRYSIRRLIQSMLLVGATAFLLVWAVFGFESEPWLLPARMIRPMTLSQRLAVEPDSFGKVGHWLLQHPGEMPAAEFLLQRMPIPAPSLLRGLVMLSTHQITGHPSYFLGMYSNGGWWYYFPVVMAVKTPTGMLVLFLLAVTASSLVLFRDGAGLALNKLRKLNPDWYALALPSLFYFAVCLRAHINIGIRHVLPVYPLVFIWCAAVLFSQRLAVPLWIRRIGVLCVVLVAVESLMEFPNYLGFFNMASGGPRMGWKYVVDSNMDLGQDVKKLPRYLADHGITNVCLAYFGAARLNYFGIHAQPVPASVEEARQSGCVVVMSMTQLMFDRDQRGQYRWLDQFSPADYVGSSYRVYNLPR
jgi:Dolichyl-phosphate-mannose-protein mannosyltransferase